VKIVKSIRKSHQWDRYVAVRIVLAAGTLVSMILASGAGSYWN
jgi:hypothetical protein